MNFEDFIDQVSNDLENKTESNSLNRDDLEKLFTILFRVNKLLFYFDNQKLNNIQVNQRNLFLFFAVFIKNYLAEISQYIENVDLSDEYTLEIKEEINKQNNQLISSKKSNTEKKEYKDNSEIFLEIENLFKALENNQKLESEKNLIDKLNKNKSLLYEKENEIKKIIDDLVISRNKYLKCKAILEEKYNKNLSISEHIENIKTETESDITDIENSIKSLNTKIKNIVELNQKLHDELEDKHYPFF